MYNKGNHSIKSYQYQWKSVSKYIKSKHRSKVMSLTGNQYPYIKRATTASMAINFTGNQVPHITTAATGKRLSASPEITIHICQTHGNPCPQLKCVVTASTAIKSL